jgi:threonine/homoserine/homoserine lactone efflux protein
MLLGAFQVSVLHNIVHLLYGIAGIACARTPAAARSFLVWGGAVYLVLWIYGLIISPDSGANFVPVNTPDNWLHFVLGTAMLALGLALGRNRARTPGRRP